MSRGDSCRICYKIGIYKWQFSTEFTCASFFITTKLFAGNWTIYKYDVWTLDEIGFPLKIDCIDMYAEWNNRSMCQTKKKTMTGMMLQRCEKMKGLNEKENQFEMWLLYFVLFILFICISFFSVICPLINWSSACQFAYIRTNKTNKHYTRWIFPIW